MKTRDILLALIASLLVILLAGGCKSQAQKAAEKAQADYEKAVIASAKKQISAACVNLQEAGFIAPDTTIIFEHIENFHGAELEAAVHEALVATKAIRADE